MKSFKEFSQDEQLVEQYTTEALNFLQRIQRSRAAKRSKSKRLIGMRRALKKIVSDPKKLIKRAIKTTKRRNRKEIVEGCFISISRNCKKNRNRKKT